MEASMQNLFELCAYASTIVFARPEQFRYPVLMSAVATIIAGGLYAEFVRRKRGHLTHLSRCLERNGEKDPRRQGVETVSMQDLP